MRLPTLFPLLTVLCACGAYAGTPDAVPAQALPASAAGTHGSGSPANTEIQVKAAEHASHDRFVGTWDVGYEIYDKNGGVRRYRGQVICRWILGGEALQEIWTSDSHDKQPQPYGTLLGFYDGKSRRWTEVWVYPAQGAVTVVSGGPADAGIVLTGRNQTGALERWSTGDIQADSFVSRFEISADEGKTWRLLGVNHVQRHRA